MHRAFGFNTQRSGQTNMRDGRIHLTIPCSFAILSSDGAARTDDATMAIHLYRIAQEAVSNAVRHGKAKQVTIRFSGTGDQLVLTVQDDGCGLAGAPQDGTGMGLLIMKHRASMIGASLAVTSVPEHGTLVTCSVNKPSLPTHSAHDA